MTRPRDDAEPAPDVAAIVLAGGRSSRFGSDKLEALLDGRPLLVHAIDAVRTVAARVVVAGAAGDQRRLPDGVEQVADAREYEGPLVGVAHTLAALDRAASIVVVVAGDMPGMVPGVLRMLIEEVRAGSPGAVLDDGRVARPLPAAYAVEILRPVIDGLVAGGERRLRMLPGAVDAAVIPRSAWEALDPTGSTLRDVDRLADLPSAARGVPRRTDDAGRT